MSFESHRSATANDFLAGGFGRKRDFDLENYAGENVTFIGRCDSLSARDLGAYDDSAKSISYRTFCRIVGCGLIPQLTRDFGVPLYRDWHVSFSRGCWRGKPAVCLMHSAYHHIWVIRAV